MAPRCRTSLASASVTSSGRRPCAMAARSRMVWRHSASLAEQLSSASRAALAPASRRAISTRHLGGSSSRMSISLMVAVAMPLQAVPLSPWAVAFAMHLSIICESSWPKASLAPVATSKSEMSATSLPEACAQASFVAMLQAASATAGSLAFLAHDRTAAMASSCAPRAASSRRVESVTPPGGPAPHASAACRTSSLTRQARRASSVVALSTQPRMALRTAASAASRVALMRSASVMFAASRPLPMATAALASGLFMQAILWASVLFVPMH
mmetsp:Transcript_115313/g.372633  ORF Transcript_115313/g.372633 Transcript_115313/m.372633 type:complete len:271 (+) Transcript_115313:1810-2622(+)